MDARLEELLANFASLQRLDDDEVKLVAYNIVCLEYGRERLMEGGSGTLLLTENMTADNFVAFLISDYLKQAPGNPKDAAAAEPGSLAVHFSVVRRWPRRDPKFDEKTLGAIAGIRDALQPVSRKGREDPS